MEKHCIMILVLLIILVCFAVVFKPVPFKSIIPKAAGLIINSDDEGVKTPEDYLTDETLQDHLTDPESIGGEGGGDSGGGGSVEEISNMQQNPGCVQRQISYSMKKFTSNSECNQYLSESCNDKTVTCSVEIQNLDYEISGFFEVEFRIFEVGNEGETLNFKSSESYLGPRMIRLFEESFKVEGEDANKNLKCRSTTAKVPKKEVC